MNSELGQARGMKASLLVFLLSLPHLFAQEGARWPKNTRFEESSEKLTERLFAPLNLVVLKDSGFRREEILDSLKTLQEIYQQCDFQFYPVKFIYLESHQTSFIKYDLDDPRSIRRFRQKLPLPENEINVFFVKSMVDREEQSGFSIAPWSNGIDLKPQLYNTVWVTDYVHSEEYRTKNNDRYHLLAHELLHVLTLHGQHIPASFGTLMSVSMARTNKLHPKSCELMGRNKLVKYNDEFVDRRNSGKILRLF